ncbi:hypothetical protein [Dyadobacter diqingensis]|uniref:hypothetical protein n=1 Tax=Dyadobacter diqingensis TaxID=2938121 RepID=UPI0020C197E2|nr:hypothetical protein [Dyadobacter diqingensis]
MIKIWILCIFLCLQCGAAYQYGQTKKPSINIDQLTSSTWILSQGEIIIVDPPEQGVPNGIPEKQQAFYICRFFKNGVFNVYLTEIIKGKIRPPQPKPASGGWWYAFDDHLILQFEEGDRLSYKLEQFIGNKMIFKQEFVDF